MTDTSINRRMSKRLLAVTAMVTPGNRVADIGTDHAYVPVYLVENGIAPCAIAMDVRKGPLARAEQSVREAGLLEHIQLRLSDGMEKLMPGEADTAVIAGMGGMLVCHILTGFPETTASLQELVLEPQSETYKVRYLITASLGFVITDEQMVCEDGKYYPVIRAEKREEVSGNQDKAASGNQGNAVSGNQRETVSGNHEESVSGNQEEVGMRKTGAEGVHPLSEIELRFGPVLLEKKDPVLYEYLGRRIRVNEAVAERLESAGSEHALQRLQEVKEELRLLKAAYDSYEM
ncbi:MAG: class I SAM-dependent methyltransferase [Eubacterium sp.]|nr:class I SAM-dependent methyltransferase [Eubacterium sp.]